MSYDLRSPREVRVKQFTIRCLGLWAAFSIIIYNYNPSNSNTDFITSAEEGGYVFGSVCLSVCPSDYSQTCERILTNFFVGVGHGSRRTK